MSHDYETMKHCVEEYLRYVASIPKTLEFIDGEITYTESRLTLCGYSYDEARGGSSTGDQLPEGVIKLMELRDRRDTEHAHFADDFAHAEDMCLPIHPNRHVVWLHYIGPDGPKRKGRPWTDGSKTFGCCERQAREMGHQGIIELYHLMPERWRRDTIPNAMPK